MAHFVKYEYSKPRRTFGRQPLFQAVPGHLLDTIAEDKTLQKQYILRNPVNRAAQATLPQSQHDCNTKRIKMRDVGLNHFEGGWPREVHPENEELVQRHKRRCLHDENYVQCVQKVAPVVEHCLKQNNAIEMYEAYFSNMLPQEFVEKMSIKVANVFRDPFERTVSSTVWTHESVPKLVVSHYSSPPELTTTDSNSQQKQTQDGTLFNHCYVWDIHNESSPLEEIVHEFACWRLASSPVDADVLVGGMENGVVNIFDIRQGSAVLSSSVHRSHYRPITGILFLNTRTNSEFFTGAPDGQCLWWDMRDLSKPVDRLLMSVRLSSKEIPTFGNAEGISTIQYDRLLPTRFLSGTESGLVINANRMGKTHNEILTNYWNTHYGPVRAIHRCPCTSRIFITCGDYTVRIWSEEVRTAPIIETEPYNFQVTNVAWVPQRFSSYMAICEGGIFHYWDLLRQRNSPLMTLKVSTHSLRTLTPQAEGELVALGDDNGSTFLVKLSEGMIFSGNNDKVKLLQMFEREAKREHILDNRVKEINLKRRQEEEKQNENLEEQEPELEDEEIDALAEENYFAVVNKQLEAFGISSPEFNQ